MDEISYIPLEKIQGNPYQTRGSEDAEHIQRLALSIAQHGMLQIPSGRPTGKGGKVLTMAEAREVESAGCQLAFGHSRLAAYRILDGIRSALLAKQQSSFEDAGLYADLVAATTQAIERGESWARMPVNLVDMSDEEMFSAACTENAARQDLNPIDEARAMLRWRKEFGKKSKEIGLIFGMSESAVRNKMRLVELPEQAQEVIASGQVTEHAARRLLTLRDTMGDETLGEVAKELASQNFDRPSQADGYIEEKVRNDKRSKLMYYSYQEDQKTAGSGMWPLDWKAEGTILPNTRQVGQMLPDPQQAKELKGNIQATLDLYLSDRSDEGKRVGDPDVVAAVEHLVSLPACKTCKHFLRIRNEGYCGRKVCWEYKRDLWFDHELRRLSEEMGIAIYNPAEDGDVFESAPHWEEAGQDRFRAMLKDDKGHLRLRIADNLGWPKTAIIGNPIVELISISDESCGRMRQAKTRAERDEATRLADDDERHRKWANMDKTRSFLDVAAVPFGMFFFRQGLSILAVLNRAMGDHCVLDGLSDSDKIREYQQSLGMKLVLGVTGPDIRMGGPVASAKYLSGVAKEIGLELPANWMDQAQQFEDGAHE